MNNTGIMLVLAYPETIVRVSDEWFSPFLSWFGIGKKNYVRAGHAALVLIDKNTGILEYHDFGRYIVPQPYGRIRSKTTDCELDFSIKANLTNDSITNLQDILKFLATHPHLTHGSGRLIASVCTHINYNAAKTFISNMQKSYFTRYAAFITETSNCARFVTDTLIASVTEAYVKKRLIQSKRFSPSTIGNVINANTSTHSFQVSQDGELSRFKSSVFKINRMMFFDRLKTYQPNLKGTLLPMGVDFVKPHAQWLGGIGAGAWFELSCSAKTHLYVFRRISAYGNIDVEGLFTTDNSSFDYQQPYKFVHHSNCLFFHIKQNNKLYRFDLKEKLS